MKNLILIILTLIVISTNAQDTIKRDSLMICPDTIFKSAVIATAKTIKVPSAVGTYYIRIGTGKETELIKVVVE
jgi:hypothetical protein